MPNRVLENVTINEPVADITALNAIPTASLVTGVVCMVNSENEWYRWNGAAWVVLGSTGSGDVNGPASSTDDHFALFDGITGKLLKDGGAPLTTTLTDVSNTSPNDGQILKWSAGSGEYIPSDDSGGNGYEFFDAYVGSGETYTTLQSALDAGHLVIKVVTNTTETTDITLSGDTSIWFGNNVFVNMGTNRINISGNVIDLNSTVYDNSSGITFALTSSNSCIYTSGGGECHARGIVIQNNSTATDCPVISGIFLTWKDVTVTIPDQLTSGVEAANQSIIDNLTITPSAATTFTNALTTGSDCRITNLYIQTATLPNTQIISNGSNSILDQVIFDSNTSSFEIHNSGHISNLNASGGEVTIYSTGNNTTYRNMDIGTTSSSIIANATNNGRVDNVICANLNLQNATDSNWKATNSRFSGLVNIQANNSRIIQSDCLSTVTILNADNCAVIGCQIDSDAGGGSNLLSISGTSAHCVVTNNKVNQLPSDTSSDPTLNLIDDNTIHGTGPSGGGDVKGPASANNNDLVAFDGTTGKVIKSLGAPLTTVLNDVSATTPGDNQILKYNFGAGVYEPSDLPTSFYDAIVAPTGGDYTTVSAAVSAGHEYILVDATLASPVTETADIVFSKDVYIFFKGRWVLSDYQLDINSVSSLTIRLEGIDQISSLMSFNSSTVKGLLKNTSNTSLIMKNFAYVNASTGGDNTGNIKPDGKYYVDNIYFDCPNSINGGFDGSDSSVNEISILQNCTFNGGGSSCGAVYIAAENGTFKNILLVGDYYNNVTDSEAANLKHCVVWSSTTVPINSIMNNIIFDPTTKSKYYKFVLGQASCDGITAIGSCNIDIVAGGDKHSISNVDFGTYDRGSSAGGKIHCFLNGDNVNVDKCFNLQTITVQPGTTPRLWNISNCQISANFDMPVQKSTMTNCQLSGTFTLSEEKITATNILCNGEITVQPYKECKLIGCTAGLNETPLTTININSGATNTTVMGCVMYGTLNDLGTSTQTAANHEV